MEHPHLRTDQRSWLIELSPDLLSSVLLLLHLSDRLTCALCICKTWRTQLLSNTTLWRELKLSSCASNAHWMQVSGPGLLKLLKTVTPAAVRSFDMFCFSRDMPESFVMQALTSFSQLDKLDLKHTVAGYNSSPLAQLFNHVSRPGSRR